MQSLQGGYKPFEVLAMLKCAPLCLLCLHRERHTGLGRHADKCKFNKGDSGSSLHTHVDTQISFATPSVGRACTRCIAGAVPRHPPAAAARAGAGARHRAGLGRAPPGSTRARVVAVFVVVITISSPVTVAAALCGALPAARGRHQACPGHQKHTCQTNFR